jgi:glycosyltransferase involved in cell wall biosynthesis
VVVLHDANWWPVTVADHARRLGARVVAVHHASAEAGAIGKPGPRFAWRAGLSASQRRLYRRVDAVMAVAAPPEAGDTTHIPLRYGVDAAFRPRYMPTRGDHVLYAGRLAPEKGVDALLDAMREVDAHLELRVLGRGPSERALRRRARRLGLTERVTFGPFVADPATLARAYAHAACVVVPGCHETFGLVAVEAAASGASVVASSGVPAARQTDGIARIVPAGDPQALACAITQAVDAIPDLLAAARLSARLTWHAAFEAEARELRSVVA